MNDKVTLIMIGDSNTGKSSILTRFANASFSPIYTPTVGTSFEMIKTSFYGNILNLRIWDTSGQVRFKANTRPYYKGVNGVMVVYDVTNEDSFKNINYWIKYVRKYCDNKDVEIILIGNKVDEDKERVISFEQAHELAALYNIRFIEAFLSFTVIEELVKSMI